MTTTKEKIINSTFVKKQFARSAWEILGTIALRLKEYGYPQKMKFCVKDCGSCSKVEKKDQFVWWEEGKNKPVMRSTLVPGYSDLMYNKDLLNSDFLEKVADRADEVLQSYLERKEAEDWVNDGKLCVYRYGWGWKGAGARIITQERAKELLPKYSFGKGFYELGWTKTKDGEKALEFNELSENDMW